MGVFSENLVPSWMSSRQNYLLPSNRCNLSEPWTDADRNWKDISGPQDNVSGYCHGTFSDFSAIGQAECFWLVKELKKQAHAMGVGNGGSKVPGVHSLVFDLNRACWNPNAS